MRKLLLLILFYLLYITQSLGQGTGSGPYILQNWSGGPAGTAPTPTTLANSTYGSTGGYLGWTVNGSVGDLTYGPPAGSCSALPKNSGGTQALIYSTNAGSSGVNYVTYQLPANIYNYVIATTWFCYDGASTDLPLNVDHFTLYTGSGSGPVSLQVNDANGNFVGSQSGTGCLFGNVIFSGDGANISLQIECSGATPGKINISPGTWYQESVSWQNVASHVNLLYVGDNVGFTKPVGKHWYYMNTKIHYINATSSQFPILENPVPLWDGILSPNRATDWTQAGFNGGVPPDGSWTQCGLTLAAGSYSATTINTTLNGCPANTFYLLGPGAFTITGTVQVPNRVVSRGSGANSTFVTNGGSLSNCGQVNGLFCLQSSDGTNVSSPGTIATVSSGFQQGSTQLTVSSTTGIVVGTIIGLMQCDTGFSGATCSTGSASDNGNLVVCNTCLTGASGNPTHRNQTEYHRVTNVSGSVLTITPPVAMPNFTSGQSPQIWHFTPSINQGVENMSISMGSTNAAAIATQNADQYFISGNRIIGPGTINTGFALINLFEGVFGIIQNNYLYGNPATGPNAGYGIRPGFGSFNLIQNNIAQQIAQPWFNDGNTVGNVWFANFTVNNLFPTGNFLANSADEHQVNFMDLWESNVMNAFQNDNVHGSSADNTLFRNHILGWESYPAQPKTADTVAVVNANFQRYVAVVGNVLGLPPYHDTYQATGGLFGSCGGTGCIYQFQNGDPLNASTMLRWGNYDTVTPGSRFINAEVPETAPVYPNQLPVFGNPNAVPQQAMPASFIYTSRPSWWSASIPFPAIGPEVLLGNVGYCSGILNTVGQFSGMPATTVGQCGPTTLLTGWLGHVNAIPAMKCYLSTMGGPPDGSGAALSFNANTCYAGGATSPSLTFSVNPVSFGSVGVGSISPTISITVTNTGTADEILSTPFFTITGTNLADFSRTGGTCANSGTITLGGGSCTIILSFAPAASGTRSATLNIFGTINVSDNLSGIGVLGPAVQMATIEVDILPLPLQPPVPNLTKTLPSQSYVTSSGISQDGITFSPKVIYTILGSNITSTSICQFDGVPITCTCVSGSCVLTIPVATFSIPVALQKHFIGIGNPSSIPVLN